MVAWALPFAFSVTKVGAFLLWLENGHDIILKEGAIPNGIPNFFMLYTPRDFEIFSTDCFPQMISACTLEEEERCFIRQLRHFPFTHDDDYR